MATPDDDLSQQIMAALQAEPRLDLRRYPIRARSDGNGGLRLEGEVADICAKRIAAARAQGAAGALQVTDALTLAPDQQASRTDAQIRDALVNALLQQRELHNCTVRQQDNGRRQLMQEAHDDWPSGEIEIDVAGGEVSLTGKVISLSHKRMIEALAWRTAGCRNVVDRLQVAPAEDDNDDELTDAVRLVLEMDPMVHADQVGIRSEGGVVTLAGVLPRDDERHLAEMDAWSVWGVVDVRNRIEVRPA